MTKAGGAPAPRSRRTGSRVRFRTARPAGGDSRPQPPLPGTGTSRSRITPQPASLRSRNAARSGWSTCLRRPLRNEFGAASRQSLALGPGSHSAFAACARESSGESCAQTLNRAFPEACNAAKRSGRLSGTQRQKLPRSGTEPTFAEVSSGRAPRSPRRARCRSRPCFRRPNRLAPRTGTRRGSSARQVPACPTSSAPRRRPVLSLRLSSRRLPSKNSLPIVPKVVRSAAAPT